MIVKYTDFEYFPRIDNYINTIFVVYNDENGLYEIKASNEFGEEASIFNLAEWEDREEVEIFFDKLYKVINEKECKSNIVDIDILKEMTLDEIEKIRTGGDKYE